MRADQKLFIPDLSVQKDGDEYMIGSKELDEFYQFPEEGVIAIDLLRQGLDPQTVQKKVREQTGERIDINDFIDLLLEVGFAYESHNIEEYQERIKNRDQGLLSVKINTKVAKVLTSLPALIAYLAIVSSAGFLAFSDERYGIDASALIFTENITFTLLALLVLYMFATMIHELGHLTAAASLGVDSNINIGNRLWSIVVEADITGIMSQPKHKRYFPLLAGMMMDIFTISLIVFTVVALTHFAVDLYYIQLAKALLLQILFTMIWQFNLFIKTDIYYVFCNYYSYQNLDLEARQYIADKSHSLSFGLLGKKYQGEFYNLKVLRIFSFIWLAGRILSVIFLITVIIPTLVGYYNNAVESSSTSGNTLAQTIDYAAFFLICSAVLIIGLVMWSRQKRENI